jgi:hypothetical protein
VVLAPAPQSHPATGQSSSTGARQPVQSPQIPLNLQSGSGAFNPFAGLTGAQYAGRVPLPNPSMFGADRIVRTLDYANLSVKSIATYSRTNARDDDPGRLI